MTSRQKFELWIESNGWNVDRTDKGDYRTMRTEAMWVGWNACAAQKGLSDASRREVGAHAIDDMLKSMTYLDFDTAMRYADRLRKGLK